MLVTIENAYLKLSVETLGAQMMSIEGSDGCQYLWQGDPAYWGKRAPVLFPFIARLDNRQYQYAGRVYSMTPHGFANQQEFAVTSLSAEAVVLALHSSAATKEIYPFDFTLEITYRLDGSILYLEHRIYNTGADSMHFALGGHPGFRVPINGEGCFEDYYLEFSAPARPDRISFSDAAVLVNGQTTPYPLENGTVLPLQHSLFDADAIILQNAARQVALKSKVSDRQVVIRYPNMPYVGFWHKCKADAPFVCIEPWSSLPGRDGVLEDISCRSDFIHLMPGKTYENIWSIAVLSAEQAF